MTKVLFPGRFIGECAAALGRIPRGYGLAYIDFASQGGVYYPWPFNKVIGWSRAWWFAHRDRAFDKYEQKEVYNRGYDSGYRAGYRAHVEELKVFINEELGPTVR